MYTIDNFKLDPWWITGFTDGEGSFHVSITETKNYKLGWVVQPRFQIGVHVRDHALLEVIKNNLCAGEIYKYGPKALQFRISSKEYLMVILKFLNKYKLQTQKRADCELWMEVCEMMERKEHLTTEGLHKIIAIRASMNRGLSEKLKLAFPDVVRVERPLVENAKIPDPNWLAGFTSAEGCFMVRITESKTKIGGSVNLVFQITQHLREEELMQSLIKYFKCGYIEKDKSGNRNWINFRVYNFREINEKIIPFFKKYQIYGVKALDYLDWCKVAELMQNKVHLTKEGIDEIKKIKSRMNTGRKF